MCGLLPAETYYGYALKQYETKDKSGTITGYKWRAVYYYKDESGKRHQKNVTLKTEGRDKGRSKQVEKAANQEAESIRQQLNEQAVKDTHSGETVA